MAKIMIYGGKNLVSAGGKIAAGSTSGTYIYNESAFPQAQWEKL